MAADLPTHSEHIPGARGSAAAPAVERGMLSAQKGEGLSPARCRRQKGGIVDPENVDVLGIFERTSGTSDNASWVRGWFAYGGNGSGQSVSIYFAMPPDRTGSEDSRVIASFSSPQVEQHWSEDVWPPSNLAVTGSPHR